MLLNEVCDVYSGYALKTFNDTQDGIPVVKIGNITEGGLLDLSTCQYTTESVKDKYYSQKGDVYVALSGATTGKIGIMNDCTPHIVNQRVGIVRLKEKSIPVSYIKYFLMKNTTRILEEASGCAQPNISPTQIALYSLPNYSEEMRTKIVETLDRLTRIVALRRRVLRDLDALIIARFVEMFGNLADPACKWEKCRLVDACTNSDDIKCGPFGTQLGKDEYTEEGVAVWEIPQINSEFKTLPAHFVTEEKAEALDAYSIIPGDIAMSRKGNVGRCAVFPAAFENGIIHSDVLRIRLDKTKAFPEFMMRQLHYSGDIQHQIELVSSGAIMAGINVTKLKQIYVYLPPIDLQGKFVEFVAQVDKSKVIIQKSLDETQLLFDSLMQEYFG